MQPLSTLYRADVMEMLKKSLGAMTITPDNVYQPGNKAILPYIDKMIADHLVPGSTIRSMENLAALSALARQGKSCLLLVEHYSNFDLPTFHYMLRQAGPEGVEAAEKLIAVAPAAPSRPSRTRTPTRPPSPPSRPRARPSTRLASSGSTS